VVFCSQPFTSVLIVSNRKQYRYLWYWNKVNRITGFLDSKKRPLKMVEELAVFYAKQPVYNPQMVEGVPYTTTSGKGSKNWGKQAVSQGRTVSDGQRYPQHLLAIKGDERGTVGRLHPTQKPIALLEYMIRTYTKPGHTVLDFCMGVGSTGVAARRTGRHFIGIEQDPDYFTIAKRRIERYKEDKPSA
jgi:site-specific DNA-methyltransferase (adenine-specific)